MSKEKNNDILKIEKYMEGETIYKMNILFVVTDVCENPNILSTISIASKILKILYYLIPILLIVMLVLDLGKNVVANGSEIGKNTGMIIKRIIIAMVFFMLPNIVDFTVDLATLEDSDTSTKWHSCLDNSENVAIYKRKYQLLKEKDDEEYRKNREAYMFRISQRHARATVGVRPEPVTTDGGEGSAGVGNFNGQTYNLDDDTIRKLAAKAVSEQGSDVDGVRAEVTLMANRYELYGRSYGSIVNYVINSGWFGSASKNISIMSGNPGPEMIAAAKDVLVNGNRAFPIYVDEHDCIDCGSYGFDIVRIETNGHSITSPSQLLDRSNYVQGQTVLYNRYGSTYTFWCFPTPYADPFGYTPGAYNMVKGGG